jgi:hypothetical protein
MCLSWAYYTVLSSRAWGKKERECYLRDTYILMEKMDMGTNNGKE